MTGADDTLTDRQHPQGQRPAQRVERLASSDPAKLAELQIKLIDLAHDAILIRDTASRIIAWNQGAQALYGWTEEEALGHTKLELLHTRFPISLEAVDRALAEEGFWEGLLRQTTRQGRQVITESRQVLVRDENGQPAAVLEINRDVTEREQLLQERAQAQAQELAFQETIRQMNEFLSLASHELRTPVTSLSVLVQVLRRQAQRTPAATTDEIAQYVHKQAHLLERAERQIRRLTRLLDDLLDLTRIREGKLELHLETGDLRQLIDDAIEGVALAYPDRRIVFEPAAQPLLVAADADHIEQVVINYLTNALKYSPSDRPVRVRLQRAAAESAGALARVEVQDEGPGIPLEEQAHIWDMFHRVPGIEIASGSRVGLGIGLYLCKTIVERHGGQVGVDSAPGEGARFWFTLPLASGQP